MHKSELDVWCIWSDCVVTVWLQCSLLLNTKHMDEGTRVSSIVDIVLFDLSYHFSSAHLKERYSKENLLKWMLRGFVEQRVLNLYSHSELG